MAIFSAYSDRYLKSISYVFLLKDIPLVEHFLIDRDFPIVPPSTVILTCTVLIQRFATGLPQTLGCHLALRLQNNAPHRFLQMVATYRLSNDFK